MRTIVLLGLRGAGKSSVARELARAVGCEAVDLDGRIVARAGKAIARIFSEEGERRFRDLEEALLVEALAGPPCVLAPGGGAVLRSASRDALRRSGALVVYLRARPETLAARVASDPATEAQRPALVPGGPLAEARSLLAAREPYYLEVATRVVDTDGLDVPAVAKRVGAALL